MTFKQHRDKLRAKKYEPIPQKELNQLVINNEDLDRVVNSCQRLIVKAIGKILRFSATPDYMLMEFVQVGNAAVAEAINKYSQDKIDFAYYCSIEIQNAILSYLRQKGTVRPSRVNGELKFATYHHIDAPVDNKSKFDISKQEDVEVFEMDFDLIFKLIKEEYKLFRRSYLEVYESFMGFDGLGAKTKVEVAEIFNISNQRVNQIVQDVERKMRSNDKVINYLKQF